MAYQFLWFDGFDEISNMNQKYTPNAEYSGFGTTYTNFGGIASPPYGYGRFINFNSSTEPWYSRILPGSPFTVLFAGFHFWITNPDTNERTFVQFWDYQNSVIQMEARRIYDSVTGTFLIRLYRGSTMVAVSATGIPPASWNWVSFKHHCDPVSGVFEVRLNGLTIVSYSGNTRNGAATQIHRPRITAGTPISEFAVDNVVIASGAASDDPLPECRVFGAPVPTANVSVGFTPSAGSNWSNADEIPPNDDTDYNYSNTPGATDLFDMSMPSLNGVVYAVKANFRARKDDAGTRLVAPVIRPGVTVHEGSQFSISPNYFNYGSIWQNNPDTSSSWTPSEVLAAKAGYRLVS